MISVINYTGRFLLTALFVTINNFLKRCHHLIHHFFKKKLFTKETKLVLYLIYIKDNTSSFCSAIQVLVSNIRKYLISFLITAVAIVFISMFISVIENCIVF